MAEAVANDGSLAVELPRLREDAVRLNNLVQSRAPRLIAKADHAKWKLKLAMAEDGQKRAWSVATTLQGYPARIGLDSQALGALLPDVSSNLDPSSLPAPLAKALAAAALAPISGALATGLRLKLALDSEDGGELAVDTACLRLETSDGGWSVDLVLSARAASVFGKALARAPLTDHAELLGNSPIVLEALIATTKTRLAALRNIESGDVILLPVGIHPERVTLVVRHTGARFGAGQLDGRHVTLEEVRSLPHDADEDAQGGEAGESVGFDDLEVRLEFSAGHTTVTIAELKTLAEGYVFNLDETAGDEIRIQSGGREIGRGELVRIDDRLGVRVTRIFAPAPVTGDDA